MDADTDAEDEGTDSEEPEEGGYSPPCRVAAKCLTNCPRCWRPMSLKTLRYTHMCHRTFRFNERALEQQEIAKTALLQRMAATEARKGASNCKATANAVNAAGCKYTSVLEAVERMGVKTT
jgi:hypothetical protein